MRFRVRGFQAAEGLSEDLTARAQKRSLTADTRFRLSIRRNCHSHRSYCIRNHRNLLPFPQQQHRRRMIQIQLQELPPNPLHPQELLHPQPVLQPQPPLELKSLMKITSKKLFTLHHMQCSKIVLYFIWQFLTKDRR